MSSIMFVIFFFSFSPQYCGKGYFKWSYCREHNTQWLFLLLFNDLGFIFINLAYIFRDCQKMCKKKKSMGCNYPKNMPCVNVCVLVECSSFFKGVSHITGNNTEDMTSVSIALCLPIILRPLYSVCMHKWSLQVSSKKSLKKCSNYQCGMTILRYSYMVKCKITWH